MKNTNLKKCFTASLLGIIALGGYTQVNYVEPPIMGWSSWNTYRVNINEELDQETGRCHDFTVT